MTHFYFVKFIDDDGREEDFGGRRRSEKTAYEAMERARKSPDRRGRAVSITFTSCVRGPTGSPTFDAGTLDIRDD